MNLARKQKVAFLKARARAGDISRHLAPIALVAETLEEKVARYAARIERLKERTKAEDRRLAEIRNIEKVL